MWIRIALLTLALMLIIICFRAPEILSDQNSFFEEFVNHEFLSFMGLLVTITLVSATNLFIELHKLEAKFGVGSFKKTRKDVRQSAVVLIYFLIISILIVVIKPLWSFSELCTSLINSSALFLLIASCMMLLDITNAAFRVAPLMGHGEDVKGE